MDEPAPLHDLDSSARQRVVSALEQALALEGRVRTAILYGSFARGEKFRDVDVGIELDEPFGALDAGEIAARLWEALDRPKFDIDVVPLNDAPPSFRLRVADEGIPLREREPGSALDFAVSAQLEQIDFQTSWDLAGRATR